MKICVLCVLTMALVAGAESEPCSFSTFQPFNSYTNHAGNVASGVVVALDARTATISNAMESVALPLSIFPADEQRRIAADFLLLQGGGKVSQLRIPPDVKRAVEGAEKGLCSKEESDAFCEKSESALKSYLDKQVKEGTITPAERKALGR